MHFADVVVTAQVRAAHAAGLVEVRERALDALPSDAQQSLPAASCTGVFLVG
jgi:hypothetical protein